MSFSGAEGAKSLAMGALSLLGSGLGGYETVINGIDISKYGRILSACCNGNFTLPATQRCIDLMGEIAKNLDKLAIECQKIPERKVSSTVNLVFFAVIGAASVGLGIYLGAKAFCVRRRHEQYTSIS